MVRLRVLLVYLKYLLNLDSSKEPMIASITLPELAPILTIFVGMLGGFYVLVRFILTLSEKTAEADRKERQELSKAIADMADGMQAVAISNDRIATESEKRNGHLAEISVDNKDAILKAIDSISVTQKVKEQSVEHQTIKSQE